MVEQLKTEGRITDFYDFIRPRLVQCVGEEQAGTLVEEYRAYGQYIKERPDVFPHGDTRFKRALLKHILVTLTEQNENRNGKA